MTAAGAYSDLIFGLVLKQLRSKGYLARPEDEVRLSRFSHEYVDILGRHSFLAPESVARGQLRPLTKGNDP